MGGLVGVGGGTVWGSHCSRGTLRQFGVNSYLPISMEVNQYDKTGRAMPVHAQTLVSGMTPLVCSPRFSISASASLLAGMLCDASRIPVASSKAQSKDRQ